MIARLIADAILLLHLSFIVFALCGALLAFRWRWVPWLHLPAVAWAAYVELAGRMCPLTALENHYRVLAGGSGYADSFIDHYLVSLIYPDRLTRSMEIGIAVLVLVVNFGLYAVLLRRRYLRT